MPKVARCNTCTEEHEAPRGAQCFRIMTKLMQSVQSLQEEMASIKANMDTSKDAQDGEASGGSVTGPEPDLNSLRRDTELQSAVQQRLQSLGLDEDNSSEDEDARDKRKSSLKSGRKRTAVDQVRVPVEWPHFNTFRGPGRDAPHYDDLTVSEFVQGYMTIMLDNNVKIPKAMRSQMQHLQNLMLDSTDYGWESARNAHGIVLQHMEAGKLTWSDADAVAEVRRTYCQRFRNASQRASKTFTRGLAFCAKFQDGRCTHEKEHDSPRGPVKHICAFCYRHYNASYPHPESECRNKARSKNGSEPRQEAAHNN